MAKIVTNPLEFKNYLIPKTTLVAISQSYGARYWIWIPFFSKERLASFWYEMKPEIYAANPDVHLPGILAPIDHATYLKVEKFMYRMLLHDTHDSYLEEPFSRTLLPNIHIDQAPTKWR
jgi:hypothetical protein